MDDFWVILLKLRHCRGSRRTADLSSHAEAQRETPSHRCRGRHQSGEHQTSRRRFKGKANQKGAAHRKRVVNRLEMQYNRKQPACWIFHNLDFS